MNSKKVVSEKKTKDLALTQHDPDTMRQIVQIANLADPFGEKPEANVTADNMDAAVEVLARVREAARRLEAVHAEAVKPIKAQLKPYDSERSVLKKRLEAADKAVNERLIALYLEVGDAITDRTIEGSMGSKLTFVGNGCTLEVTDADAVPDHLVMPPAPRAERLNAKAIIALIESGQDVPGVRVHHKYYTTTRAAETITIK